MQIPAGCYSDEDAQGLPSPPFHCDFPTRSPRATNAPRNIPATSMPTTSPTSALLDMGCWMDNGSRALRGGPQRYGYNVETCKAEARARFSTIFALQDGGWCTTSDGTDNYMQYGRASSCPALGGPFINHVFSIAGPPRHPGQSFITASPCLTTSLA